VLGHFDAIYGRFERIEQERVALLQVRIDELERRLRA
jgi:hypothetical protein